MRKSILFISMLLGLPLALCAQQPVQVQVNGTMEGEGFKDTKLYMRAMDNKDPKAVSTLAIDGTKFGGQVEASKDGFYQFFGVNNRMQLVLPLYFPKADKMGKLKLSIEKGCPQMPVDKNNKALSAYTAITYAKGRTLWMDGPKMTSEQLFNLINSFNTAVDSIVKSTRCAAPVEQYLRLWAYNMVANSYMSLPRIIGEGKEVAFKQADLQAAPEKVLNTPMTVYFPASSYLILKSLPEGTLAEQLAALNQMYSCKDVCRMVEGSLVENYIRNFNFDLNFEKGLEELTALTEKYQLNPKYLKEFRMRKSSAVGSPFPAGIVLKDVNGNSIDFNSFKGYYVYIDLWASWCGPCCKEAPILKKLEQEVKNPNVKFVSISIDKNEAAWKKKMEALGLHGNQFLNQDNKLAESLNVKGIPMFLIYDKEGNLYLYDAPRPSSGEKLKTLLEGLK